MPYKEKTDDDLKIRWTIGEVADIIEEYTSLIRYYESEFSQVHPKKDRNGNRYFNRKDIHTIKDIHFLVKTVGLTLDGARKALELNLLENYKQMYNYEQ